MRKNASRMSSLGFSQVISSADSTKRANEFELRQCITGRFFYKGEDKQARLRNSFRPSYRWWATNEMYPLGESGSPRNSQCSCLLQEIWVLPQIKSRCHRARLTRLNKLVPTKYLN